MTFHMRLSNWQRQSLTSRQLPIIILRKLILRINPFMKSTWRITSAFKFHRSKHLQKPTIKLTIPQQRTIQVSFELTPFYNGEFFKITIDLPMIHDCNFFSKTRPSQPNITYFRDIEPETYSPK